MWLVGIASGARAVRDGLLWMVPYLMVWTTLNFVSQLLLGADPASPLGHRLDAVSAMMGHMCPVAISGSISSMLAIQSHLPRPATAFSGVGIFVVVNQLLEFHFQWVGAVSVLLGVLLPFLTVPIIRHVSRWRWTELVRAPTAGSNVVDTLNLILPVLLATSVMVAGVELIEWGSRPFARPDVAGWVTGLPPLAAAMIYASLNSLLWSLGVHGYYALLPLLHAIDTMAASGGGVVNGAFLGTYVFIGGSGATLSLIVAILVTGQRPAVRAIALASIAPALLNINELLLFGLPLILNIRFLTPFLLVPVVNVLMSWLVIHAGWVPPAATALPFNSPIVANAWLVSGGDGAAVALQVFNVLIGAAIYAPFVMRWQHTPDRSAIRFKSLDTSFNRRQEEVTMVLDDPVSRAFQQDVAHRQLVRRLDELSQHEFVLHYQPQIDPATGRVVACEALLRLVGESGQLVMPSRFMPCFEQARLMREVDRWVFLEAGRQSSAWAEAGGPVVPIAVNLSADSLCDRATVRELVETLRRNPGRLIVEITEQAMVGDADVVQWALEQFRSAGAEVQIDDFGTGYSSLSYLHRFRVDGIKIDQSFTRSLAHERGRQLFQALIAMARQLDLSVVVEGVEESWQLHYIPQDGHAQVQGWLYAKALPADQFEAFALRPAA